MDAAEGQRQKVPVAPPQLTAKQLAVQAERKAAKAAKQAAADAAARDGAVGGPSSGGKGGVEGGVHILHRPWVTVGDARPDGARTARIVTWNMLAQTLVRRDSFPRSNCLRWGDRKALLLAEFATHATADVVCLQECDRLDDVRAALPAHAAVEARGPGKLHGVVVLYKTARFRVRASRALELDEQVVGAVGEGAQVARRRGGSRVTKNMGLIVALEDQASGAGLVVATTHLFWHPKFAYERARQVVLLLRAIRAMQAEHDCAAWPVVFAGDLNTQPSEATYHLLASPHTPLHPSLVAELEGSSVVHKTIDERKLAEAAGPTDGHASAGTGTAPATGTVTPAADDEHGEHETSDPADAAAIPNTRPAQPDDGLLTVAELVDAARRALPAGARSAYGTTSWSAEPGAPDTFAARGGFDGRGLAAAAAAGECAGAGEPGYTCYTSLFQLTLGPRLWMRVRRAQGNEVLTTSPDYLFVIGDARVTGVLQPVRAEQLGEGLPRKGVCASDHLAAGCELAW